jgi:hypothetical protein
MRKRGFIWDNAFDDVGSNMFRALATDAAMDALFDAAWDKDADATKQKQPDMSAMFAMSELFGAAMNGPADSMYDPEGSLLAVGARVRCEGLTVGPGRYRLPRHRMPFNSSNEGPQCMSRVRCECLTLMPGRYCLPRHRIPTSSKNEGSTCVSMTWPITSARPYLTGAPELNGCLIRSDRYYSPPHLTE